MLYGIEFVLYAVVGYGTFLGVISAIWRDGKMMDGQHGTRAAMAVPGMMLLWGLAVWVAPEVYDGEMVSILWYEIQELDTINVNGTVTETVQTVHTNHSLVESWIWPTFHYLMATIVFLFILINAFKEFYAK